MTIAELIRELMTLDPSLPVYRADSDGTTQAVEAVEVLGERPAAYRGMAATPRVVIS